MTKKWTPISFKPDDLQELGYFFKKVYTGIGNYGTMELFHWKIIDNPVYRGIINLIKDGGQIASTTSITPKRALVKGREYIVAEIGDTYTDPQYQRQGMFTLLINKSTEDALSLGIQLVYGTPNNQSLPGYEKKANYKKTGAIQVRSLVIPLNITNQIQRRTHWLIGNFVGCIYSIFSYGNYLYRRAMTVDQETTIEEPEHLSADWDEFWNESRREYDFIFARDRRALTWRFVKNPNRYKIYILKKEKKIIGYVAYRIIFSEEDTTLIVSDFLFLPGNEHYLLSIMSKILEDALNANVSKINVWCPIESPYYKFFKQYGFIDRSDIPVIFFRNEFALNVQENCRRWHFTISDSDNV